MHRYIFLLLSFVIIAGCRTPERPLKTASDVDVKKYMGKWYEIARLPNRFEEGLKCITARYSLNQDMTIKVINSGISIENGEKSRAEGWAKIPDKKFPGRLKVTFFWPFYGNYWIIDLDTDNYSWALVGEPSREYLWILARKPVIPEGLYKRLLKEAGDLAFPVENIIRTEQKCSR